ARRPPQQRRRPSRDGCYRGFLDADPTCYAVAASRRPRQRGRSERVSRRYDSQKRILVTGGAGFLGSHLIDRLLAQGAEVVCVDNLFTGAKRNIAPLAGESGVEFLR